MINYSSQTMNFLLNQIEVFLNSEASHLCLVWISTVLYCSAAPFELPLRAACYYTTGWKFYTAKPGAVCQKHFQVLSGWVIHYVLWNRQWNLWAAIGSIYLSDSPSTFISFAVYRGWLFGNSVSCSEFSYCGSRTDHLLYHWDYLYLVSWEHEGKYWECDLKLTKTTYTL
jgi:hypothetical protein